tara:strand:- start:12 stop:212 length:201 start_codon:yes stop_codon:yes gene_type:complete
MITKKTTLDRLRRMMSADDQPLKDVPLELLDDPDLDDPAELQTINDIMDFMESTGWRLNNSGLLKR